jgi:hypothetical protein
MNSSYPLMSLGGTNFENWQLQIKSEATVGVSDRGCMLEASSPCSLRDIPGHGQGNCLSGVVFSAVSLRVKFLDLLQLFLAHPLDIPLVADVGSEVFLYDLVVQFGAGNPFDLGHKFHIEIFGNIIDPVPPGAPSSGPHSGFAI